MTPPIYIIITSLFRSLVITAVSPNVVVDIVLWLKTEKLGLYKDIHTIIIAVTTCNDVLSIFFFRVVLTIIFSNGNCSAQLILMFILLFILCCCTRPGKHI